MTRPTALDSARRRRRKDVNLVARLISIAENLMVPEPTYIRLTLNEAARRLEALSVADFKRVRVR